MENVKFAKQLKKQLMQEFRVHDKNGVYALTQKSMAYNSNRIEGSTLTSKQTADIFDTGTVTNEQDFLIKTQDVEEMTGHFKMFNEVIKNIGAPLTIEIIKSFHYQLKSGVFTDYLNGYPAGEFKSRANMVSDIKTTLPKDVPAEMDSLVAWWNHSSQSLDDIAKFHAKYENIHPFQDGNGRTGRAIIFKQCLDRDIIPVVIYDDDKEEYYNVLSKAQHNHEYSSMISFFEREQKRYYTQVEPFVAVPSLKAEKMLAIMEEFEKEIKRDKIFAEANITDYTLGETVRLIAKSEEMTVVVDFMKGNMVIAKNNAVVPSLNLVLKNDVFKDFYEKFTEKLCEYLKKADQIEILKNFEQYKIKCGCTTGTSNKKNKTNENYPDEVFYGHNGEGNDEEDRDINL